MNTKTVAIASFVVALIVIGLSILMITRSDKEEAPPLSGNKEAPALSPKDATYVINGTSVTLQNGVAENVVDENFGTKNITRYFGNELTKDLNADGLIDSVFILTQDGGGSGTFYYVVAALAQNDGTFLGSHAVFLGDRIAPQTINSGEGNIIVVNYAVRGDDEPFTAQPSFGKSLRLILDPSDMQFGIVAEDFEGEADPARMTLQMKSWVWERSIFADGTTMSPRQMGRFTATFGLEGRFSARTDCNGAGANYVEGRGNTLSFGPMMSTQMYCEGSEEVKYTGMLAKTVQYRFTSRGMLELVLSDGTIMIFR